MQRKRSLEVYTVGHSTRTFEGLVSILKQFEVTCLVDVRSIPRSRHNPQFNQETLLRSVPKKGIHYLHMSGLGGLRHAKSGSINAAWRNASFRGYADFMQTRDFVKYLRELIKLLRTERMAIMCAEAVPWRCHRSLIADALTARKVKVLHITGLHNAEPHRLSPWAKVKGVKVWYPGRRMTYKTQ